MFWKLIITLLLVAVCIVHVWGKLKGRNLTWKLALPLVISPVIFPMGLFIYGYFFSPIVFVPSLLSWNFSWQPIIVWMIYLVVMLVLQWFLMRKFHERSKKALKQKDIREMNETRSDLWLGFKSVFVTAAVAGVYEEILFRFIMMTALYPIVVYLFPVAIVGLIDSVPGWIVLWSNSLVSPHLFTTACIMTVIFSYLHIFIRDEKKNGDLKGIYRLRFLTVWFPAWLDFIFMVRFGLLPAITFHFFGDLLGMGMGIYWYIKRLRKEIEDGSLDVSLIPE